jgi:hypothetical protein
MLVMDLMMPRINGFEATKRIKQIRTYSESSGRDLFSFRPRDLPADVPQRSGRASAQAGRCDVAGSYDSLVVRNRYFGGFASRLAAVPSVRGWRGREARAVEDHVEKLAARHSTAATLATAAQSSRVFAARSHRRI